MSELYPLVLLVPDRLHWPDIHLIMCFVIERKELKARLVVTGKSGEREDICAIFREDLNAALVDEDTQLQLSIYRSYPGMAGAFELFHSEVRYLRAVYGERMAVSVIGHHSLASATHTEIHAEGMASLAIEGHLHLVGVTQG